MVTERLDDVDEADRNRLHQSITNITIERHRWPLTRDSPGVFKLSHTRTKPLRDLPFSSHFLGTLFDVSNFPLLSVMEFFSTTVSDPNLCLFPPYLCELHAGRSMDGATERIDHDRLVQFGNSFRDPDRASGMSAPYSTHRVAESLSCNKPSRRAQIFDKGVDASIMQVPTN